VITECSAGSRVIRKRRHVEIGREFYVRRAKSMKEALIEIAANLARTK
jgi:hypothetical protein